VLDREGLTVQVMRTSEPLVLEASGPFTSLIA
jgi:hypothetical protein